MPTEPRLRFVVSAHSNPEALATLRHGATGDLDRVVCRVTPGGRTLDWLAKDMLKALGKQHDVSGSARNEAERWDWVGVWLHAEQTRQLLVDGGDSLKTGHVARLIELATRVGVDLAMLTGGTQLNRRQKELSADWGCETVGIDELADDWGASDSATERNSASVDAFPRVPRDDFVVFRARCRELLDDTEFARVDDVYRLARRATDDWLRERSTGPSEHDVADWLQRLLARAEWTDQALTELRAAQVSFFRRDRLLLVDASRFTSMANGGAVSPLTSETAGRLRWYTAAFYSTAAILTLTTGLSPGGLAELNVGDVAADGAEVQTPAGSRPVPPYAGGIVRAHLLRRQLDGATTSDALFGVPNRSHRALTRPDGRRIQRRLRRIGEETGVRLAGNWTSQQPGVGHAWMRRHGVSLQQLCPELGENS